MRISKRVLVAVLVVAALALPAAAAAHVTLQPETAPAGGFTRFDVRVPNERDDAARTRSRCRCPTASSSRPTSRSPAGRRR